MEKRKLEMEFLNTLSRKHTITIDDPKLNLIPEEVQAAMESIISENVFIVSEADLAEIVEARIVTTTVDKLMM